MLVYPVQVIQGLIRRQELDWATKNTVDFAQVGDPLLGGIRMTIGQRGQLGAGFPTQVLEYQRVTLVND